MVSRGEDIEQQQTESLVRQQFDKIVELANSSLKEFEQHIKKCDFLDSLKAYMNTEHFLQEGKQTALELIKLDKATGEKALNTIEDVEQLAYKTATDLASNCECHVSAFRYIEKLPEEPKTI